MTKPIPLEDRINKFAHLLTENEALGFGDIRYGITDVQVMMKLGCSPWTWHRVRPLLIQYLQRNNLIITEKRDDVELETLNITIRYDKKNRVWYGKHNTLNISKPSQYAGIMDYKEMTKEELEQYRISWYVGNWEYDTHPPRLKN